MKALIERKTPGTQAFNRSPRTEAGCSCGATINAEAVTEAEIKNTEQVLRIATVSTALAFGALAASTEALRSNAAGFCFQASFRTAVAAVIGGAGAVLYWKLAGRGLADARKGAWLLVLAGLGFFLYPLRFVSPEKLAETLQGLAFAVVALSTVGFMLWRVKRFLDEDTEHAKAIEAATAPAGPSRSA